MAILIKFTNPNTSDVTINIYRGDAMLDRANLGTPLDTLTGRPTEYLDKTAVQGNTYYYVFETIGSNDRDISRNVKIIAAESRGPGNNILREGTRDLGYYDLFAAGDLLDSPGLIAKIGGSTGWTATASFSYWAKYARNGKVIFVPSNAIGRATAQVIKAIGLNGEGKIIEQNGFRYKVRLAFGFGETNEDAIAFLADKAKTTPFDMEPFNNISEYSDLFFPLFNCTPLTQRLSNKLNIAPGTGMSGGTRVMTNETLDGNSVTARGQYNNSNLRMQAGAGSWDTSQTNICSVWPVLELIED